jgi:hypothetical protein
VSRTTKKNSRTAPPQGRQVHVAYDACGEVTGYALGAPRPRKRSHPENDLELRALVGLAWEARPWPGNRAQVEAIEAWHDRRHVRAWERRQRQHAYLVQVLRETSPAPRAATREEAA